MITGCRIFLVGLLFQSLIAVAADVTIADIESNPKLLPPTVKLKKQCLVDLYSGDKKVGSSTLRPGTEVTVTGVSNGKLLLLFSRSAFEVSPEDTDLWERVVIPEPSPAPFIAVEENTAIAEEPAPQPQSQPETETPPQKPLVNLSIDEHDHAPGTWQNYTFSNLPKPQNAPKTFLNHPLVNQEDYEIYIPANYDPANPPGILVWTCAGEGLSFPKNFTDLLEKYYLVGLAYSKGGNTQESERRVNLGYCGAKYLEQFVRINPKRRITSGLSGGAKIACVANFAYPEFYSGAIGHVGFMVLDTVTRSDKPGYTSYGYNQDKNTIPKSFEMKAKQNSKFVGITGDQDYVNGNLLKHYINDYVNHLKKRGFKTMIIDDPAQGHHLGSVEHMDKSLEFVLGKPN